MLVGDIHDRDGAIPCLLRLAPEVVEESGMECGVRGGERVIELRGQIERSTRPRESAIRKAEQPERERGGRETGDGRVVAEPI